MTTSMGETTSLEFGHYLRTLRRNALLVLLCAVLGLAVAFAYLQAAGQSVTATTAVNVNVISTDPFTLSRSPSQLLDSETEVQALSSSAVLSGAATTIGGGATTSSVRGDSSASLVPNSTSMRISYTAPTAAAAEAGADAVAQSYLDFRAQQATTKVTTIVDQLQTQRDSLRDDLVRLNTIIADATAGSGRAVQAESDRQLINIQLDSLSSQINSFLGLDTTGGTVLTAAAQSPTKVSPSRSLVLVTGLVLGLLIGIVLAFVRGALDRRIRDGADVRRHGGGDVFAVLSGGQARVPATDEDLDGIRTVRELLFATMPDDPPVVAVADLSSGPAVSDVAVNLAEVAAQSGRDVVLLMADASTEAVDGAVLGLGLSPLRSSDGVRRFARADEHGGSLTLVVSPRGTLALPVGAQPVGSHAATGSSMTVIAVPQDAARASLLAAGRLGHAVVLVVSKDSTSATTVARAAHELSVVGATVNGTVLVPRKRKPAAAAPVA